MNTAISHFVCGPLILNFRFMYVTWSNYSIWESNWDYWRRVEEGALEKGKQDKSSNRRIIIGEGEREYQRWREKKNIATNAVDECVCVRGCLCVCMYRFTHLSWNPWRPGEGSKSSYAGVTGNCEEPSIWGTICRTSAKVACTLDCWASSPVDTSDLWYVFSIYFETTDSNSNSCQQYRGVFVFYSKQPGIVPDIQFFIVVAISLLLRFYTCNYILLRFYTCKFYWIQ